MSKVEDLPRLAKPNKSKEHEDCRASVGGRVGVRYEMNAVRHSCLFSTGSKVFWTLPGKGWYDRRDIFEVVTGISRDKEGHSLELGYGKMRKVVC